MRVYLPCGNLSVVLVEVAPYSQGTITLNLGDTVIVFSDGVSEALDTAGQEFGDDRLIAVAEAARERSAQSLVDAIVAAVREFTRGAQQSDDITVMVIRYLGCTP